LLFFALCVHTSENNYTKQYSIEREYKMDDFIYNLRSGNTKRLDKKRKPYEGSPMAGHDKRRGRSGNTSAHHKASELEQLSIFRKSMKTIMGNIKRMADANERCAKAEERKADVLEEMAVLLKTYLSQAAGSEAQIPQKDLAEVKPEADSCVATLKIIENMRAQNISYSKIAVHLEELDTPTPSGRGKWSAQTARRFYIKFCADENSAF
jgi:hypothetical protein